MSSSIPEAVRALLPTFQVDEASGICFTMPVFDLKKACQTDAEERKAMLKEIKAFYDKHGMVIFRVLGQEECCDCVGEFWDKVIKKQPLREEHMPTHVPEYPGKYASLQEKMQWLEDHIAFPPTASPKEKKERSKKIAELTKRFGLLHANFGAPCDPDVFHLQTAWDVRQNELIYEANAIILGVRELWCDINRTIARLPNHGEDAILHTDVNPWSRNLDADESCATQGKVAYTDSKFVGIPCSHTTQFYRAWLAAYSALYNDARDRVKFGIAKDKDPWGLWDRAIAFDVPAGCMVIWNKYMVHGHSKTPKDRGAEYGLFLGFMPAGSRPEYVKHSLAIMKSTSTFTEQEAILKGLADFRKKGIDELADRLRSFELGDAPLMWPSLDPICYYPKKFLNFPKVLQATRIDKLDPAKTPTCPATGVHMLSTRLNGKGETVWHLLPVRLTPYAKPVLSKLGRRLLGLEDWRVPSAGDKRGFSSCS